MILYTYWVSELRETFFLKQTRPTFLREKRLYLINWNYLISRNIYHISKKITKNRTSQENTRWIENFEAHFSWFLSFRLSIVWLEGVGQWRVPSFKKDFWFSICSCISCESRLSALFTNGMSNKNHYLCKIKNIWKEETI